MTVIWKSRIIDDILQTYEPFPKPPKNAQGRPKPGIEKTRETLYIGVTKQPKQGDSRYEDYNRNYRRSARASEHIV
jgi:hypothetical protein